MRGEKQRTEKKSMCLRAFDVIQYSKYWLLK